jgi:Domain of unknown function (DUF1990)
MVQWDRSDDSVWYDIYTFSRPHHPLAWAGYPLVRALQGAFRAQSARAVARAAAAETVDRSLDERTRARIALLEGPLNLNGRAGSDPLSRGFRADGK